MAKKPSQRAADTVRQCGGAFQVQVTKYDSNMFEASEMVHPFFGKKTSQIQFEFNKIV